MNITYSIVIRTYIIIFCFSVPILSPKFYSKYEFQECENIDSDIFNELKRLREIGPKEKSDEPVTENQR